MYIIQAIGFYPATCFWEKKVSGVSVSALLLT